MKSTFLSSIRNRTALPLALSLVWTVQTTSAVNAKPASAATPLEIVADGKPKAQIVVAAERPRMVTLAALELQSFLEKISGARLPIVTSPTAELAINIYVGQSAGTDKLGVTAEGLKDGAYRMLSGPDWLVLIGRDFDFDPPFKPWPMNRNDTEKPMAAWEEAIKGKTDTGWSFPFRTSYKELWSPPDYNKIMADRYGKDNATLWKQREGEPAGFWEFDEGGTLNAVYGFLGELGVHWYMPGNLGQVIPEKKTIAVGPVNETSIPDFSMRGWIWYGFFGFSLDDLIWARQLGMNSGYEKIGPLRGPHGLTNVHSHPAMKKSHPEYYALIGGERDTEHRGYGTPNFLSEGLQKETINYIRFLFDEYDLPAVDIWPVDGIMMSEDEASQGKTVSELVWGFTDRVAREVYKTHPDRFVIGGAYSTYSYPSAKIERFSPNFVVNISNAGRLNFEDPEAWERYQKLVKAWESKVAPGNIIRYENNRSGLAEPFVFPIIHPRAMAKDLQFLKGKTMGERGEVSQRRQQWQKPGHIHLPLYVQARFLWDADQNLDELLDEYYRLFYGPAAAKMKEAFAYAEEVQVRRGPSRKGDPGEGYRPFEASIRYRELLAEARKVAGDSVYGKRIDLLISELQPKEEFIAEYKAREAAIAEFRAKAPVAAGIDGADLYKAEVYTLRNSITGEETGPKTTFKVGWEDNHLIFDITCMEPKMDTISITSDVYGGDYVAISLDTPLHSFYHIEVNPDGLVADGDPGPKNSSWKSLSAVTTERGKDFWRVVVRIPVVDAAEAASDPMHRVAGEKPTAEKPWYFNVGRNRMLGARKAQTQAFSPIGGNWRTPTRFGRLEIQLPAIVPTGPLLVENGAARASIMTAENPPRLVGLAASIAIAAPGVTDATAQKLKMVLDRDGRVPKPIVAITNVTAWPNLKRLPSGDIVALIYNRPSHGRMPGDVECWASTDEGQTWTKRSVAAPRGTPAQNRMNVAAGLTAAGDLILVTSGWSDPGNPDRWSKIGHVLPTWVCISKDNGVTWSIDRDGFPSGPDGRHLIPFGDIMPGADGKLRVAAYRGPRGPADGEVPPVPEGHQLARRAAEGQNWVVRGDGHDWDPPTPLSPTFADGRNAFSETALLHLGDGTWLAAARYGSGSTFVHSSTNDAQTWIRHGKVRGYPAHLLELTDGTIVLSYGQRGGEPRGVDVVFSDDKGRTWSNPYRIVAIEGTDLGYPSSVLRKDGQVVTAYYEGGAGVGYFMGVVVWDPVRTQAGR